MIILIMVKAEPRNLLDQLQASIDKTNDGTECVKHHIISAFIFSAALKYNDVSSSSQCIRYDLRWQVVTIWF